MKMAHMVFMKDGSYGFGKDGSYGFYEDDIGCAIDALFSTDITAIISRLYDDIGCAIDDYFQGNMVVLFYRLFRICFAYWFGQTKLTNIIHFS